MLETEETVSLNCLGEEMVYLAWSLIPHILVAGPNISTTTFSPLLSPIHSNARVQFWPATDFWCAVVNEHLTEEETQAPDHLRPPPPSLWRIEHFDG